MTGLQSAFKHTYTHADGSRVLRPAKSQRVSIFFIISSLISSLIHRSSHIKDEGEKNQGRKDGRKKDRRKGGTVGRHVGLQDSDKCNGEEHCSKSYKRWKKMFKSMEESRDGCKLQKFLKENRKKEKRQ